MTSASRLLQPAEAFEPEALAALMERCYSDYEVPMHIDAAAFRFMARSFDLDMAESRVVSIGGTPVAIGLLGLRNGSAWVGGMGTAPEARRQGHAEAILLALLERARARSAREVWLEVLEQNVRAIPLYEKLGFAHVRTLNVWRLPLAPERAPGCETHPVPPAEARAFIASARRFREPWQRADASLERWTADGLALEGTLAVQGGAIVGAAVHRAAGERVSLLQARHHARPRGRRNAHAARLGVPARGDAGRALAQPGRGRPGRADRARAPRRRARGRAVRDAPPDLSSRAKRDARARPNQRVRLARRGERVITRQNVVS